MGEEGGTVTAVTVNQAATVTTVTPNTRVARWVREFIEDEPSIDLPAIAGRAADRLMDNPDLNRQFLLDALTPQVYNVAQRVVAQTRLGRVLFGDLVTTVEVVRQAAKGRRAKWELWLEHSGERHIRLTKMTREQLLVASVERKQRGMVDVQLGALWELLASGMAEGQTVEEVYSAEQIDAIRLNMRVEVITTIVTVQDAAD